MALRNEAVNVRRQFDKRTGKTYLYLSTDRWNSKKNRSESTRKIVGKLDVETGNVLATSGKNRGSVIGHFDPDNFLFFPIGNEKIGTEEFIAGELRNSFNSPEQKAAYDLILDDNRKMLFISGSGGAGKTTVLVRAYTALALAGKKVLTVSFTGIAADNINIAFHGFMEKLANNDRKKSFPKEVFRICGPGATTIHSAYWLARKQWFSFGGPQSPKTGGDTLLYENICLSEKKIKKIMKETNQKKLQKVVEYAIHMFRNKLASYDVIFLDEASMVSSNLIDILLRFKQDSDAIRRNKGKPETRFVMFGDLYQLKPVVRLDNTKEDREQDPEKFDFTTILHDNYEKHYHGGKMLYCCDGLSKRKDEHPEIMFYELKENHRIHLDPQFSQKRLNDNIKYIQHLETIKVAQDILYKAVVEKNCDRVELLKPLHEAFVFFNRSCRCFSRHLQMTNVKDAIDRGFFPKVICGTNRRRYQKNRRMVDVGKKESAERRTFSIAISTEADNTAAYKELGIPRSYDLYINAPVIFTKTVYCRVVEEEKENEKVLMYKCCNGLSGKVSGFEEDAVYIKIISIRGDEIEVGPVSYVDFHTKLKNGTEVLINKLPIDPAFSLTYHKVQGQTLESVYLLTSIGKRNNFLDSNSMYVGLSRGTDFSCLGISKRIPLPLSKDMKKVNEKNLYTLFRYYFRLEKPKENDKETITCRFFLNDIKKAEPEVYTNWTYCNYELLEAKKEAAVS